VLVLIAEDRCARLVELGAALDVTDRTVSDILADLIDAGYVVKHREGRRNCYDIDEDRSLHNSIGIERTVGDLLDLFVDSG
jgi:Mn-dependent DtxR family transcriptional regulator